MPSKSVRVMVLVLIFLSFLSKNFQAVLASMEFLETVSSFFLKCILLAAAFWRSLWELFLYPRREAERQRKEEARKKQEEVRKKREDTYCSPDCCELHARCIPWKPNLICERNLFCSRMESPSEKHAKEEKKLQEQRMKDAVQGR